MAVDKEKAVEESVTSRLFKIILSWDYFRLLKNSKVRLLELNYSLFIIFSNLASFCLLSVFVKAETQGE